MTETNSVTGVAWYRREDWSRLREIASDRTNLDDSYEAWLAGAQKTLLDLAIAGVAARRVSVDIEALVRWCRGSPSRQRRPGSLRRGSAATCGSGVGGVNKPSNIVLDPTARQGGAVWIAALPRAAGHHAR